MESRTVPASMEHLDEVMMFLDALLCRAGCPEEERRLIEISVEELFTNIASYAYGAAGGKAKIEADIREVPPESDGGDEKVEARIWLSDQGTPFDPFSGEDPDIHLPIEERPVGGLGIYMVKRFMDRVSYERKDGRNVVSIVKRFSAERPRTP